MKIYQLQNLLESVIAEGQSESKIKFTVDDGFHVEYDLLFESFTTLSKKKQIQIAFVKKQTEEA